MGEGVTIMGAKGLLEATKQYSTKYCIPLWLRDEQIRQAIVRIQGRIQPGDRREDRLAVVAFGPSLNKTWEQLKDFPYIMSCSGAHKFLVEHGIIPTWHVEVDPRPHKVKLIGQPQKETEYLIASTCHAAVFDHLEGYNVKLWHVFDASEDGQRLLPAGEWALTGGCDVGLRALTVAGFIGFRDIHVFGMDHCAGTMDDPSEYRHADKHPLGQAQYSPCEYNGVTYRTTRAMLTAAQQVGHELDMMPAVKTTFYGDGLCQAMMRDYVRKETTESHVFANMLGISKPELITPEYAALNAQLHKENLAYGVGGGRHAKTVQKLCDTLRTQSVLDYGCGKGYLGKALPFPIWEYDPAVPGKTESPRPAELVVCTDVLEHIEPDKLGVVLDDLSRVVMKVGYFVIHTKAAQKKLPDGRNAHLIQQEPKWWRNRLAKFFQVGKIWLVGPEVHVIVGPIKESKADRNKRALAKMSVVALKPELRPEEDTCAHA